MTSRTLHTSPRFLFKYSQKQVAETGLLYQKRTYIDIHVIGGCKKSVLIKVRPLFLTTPPSQNEEKELKERYLKFDLAGLVNAAVGVCKGAEHCTSVLKCNEGSFNKAFILTMDNGTEVVARLPNPNAGPARYTTASEVATRELLRHSFKIPVPQILAWSCDPMNNAVKAEYMIEEKAPGVRLGTLWRDLPWKAKLSIVTQVVDMDHSLCSVGFNMHGSIYFKEDLQRLTGNVPTIQFLSDKADVSLEKYTMGPSTTAELWNNGGQDLNLDRGPWQTPQHYTHALGVNEKLWVMKHAKPQMNYSRSLKYPDLSEQALELLDKYEKVASHIVPELSSESAYTNVLWHPYLHVNNIFVDPVSHKITAIIDWQSATVAPLFFQSGIHSAFRHSKPVREGFVLEKPAGFDSMPPEEKSRIKEDLESKTIHQYYQAQTKQRAPKHWDVLQDPVIPLLRKPTKLVTGVWEGQKLFFLRESLITLAAKWKEIFGEDTPRPITFSSMELEAHADELGVEESVGAILSTFRDQNLIPTSDMVEQEDFEAVVANCRHFKKVFLDLAEDEEQRELFDKIWPYPDFPQ